MQDKFTEEEYTQLKHEIENIKTHLGYPCGHLFCC